MLLLCFKKDQTLFHLHSPKSDPEPPVPILPATCSVGAKTRGVERKANEEVEILPGTLPNRLFAHLVF